MENICDLSFCLIGYLLGGGFGCLGITEIVVTDRPAFVVKFVDQGNSGGNIQSGDIFVGDIIQILDQGPKAVPVCGNEDLPALLQGGNNHVYWFFRLISELL